MFAQRKLLSSMALLLVASSQLVDSISASWLSQDSSEPGLIELDATIVEKKHPQEKEIGLELMSLREQGSSDSDVHDYIEKQLKNLFNIQITSKMLFGSQKQPMELIFDSGSSWVWIEHATCDTCANQNKFNSWASSTFQVQQAQPRGLYYGIGNVHGIVSKDLVCLTPSSTVGNGCMENYTFMAVTSQQHLSGLATSGIVGLSPSSWDDAQLFVPSLYQQGAIKKNMFSMYLNPAEGASKI
jgi:hypothetical protein